MKIISSIFILLLLFNCTEKAKTIPEKETIIAIQPFEDFEKNITDSISSNLKKIYGFNIIVLPKIALPDEAITTFKGKRYDASQLIQYLKKTKIDSIDYVMGLTSQDICITKKDEQGNILKPENKYRDFGIFGLGYRPGVSSVISTKRLKISNKKLFLERIKKVTTHEFGHNLGIPHCENDALCVMQSAAEKLSKVDGLDLRICEKCKKIMK